jgi:lysophospholipase L1-like esterase
MRPLSRKRKLVFSFLTFLAFLVLAELSSRVYYMICCSTGYTISNWFWTYEQDRFLDFHAKPNLDITLCNGAKVNLNSEGFRDVDIPIVPERGRRLIICVGESSTWGLGASDNNHTYPKLLEEELKRASTEPFVVMNAGFPAYTTVHNLQLLQMRLLKYKPEAILYMGFSNDCTQYAASLENETDFNLYPRVLATLPDSWATRTLMRSSLFSLLTDCWRKNSANSYQRIEASLPAEGAVVTQRGETLFRDQIAQIKLLCQRHTIKLIWVDQVINTDPSQTSESQMKLHESLRAILHDELRRQNIPLLQANDRYDHAAAPMIDKVHLTDLGNAQLAKILAPQLIFLLKDRHASNEPTGNRNLSGNESRPRP